MRDPKRIYPATQALAEIWMNLPDWRFGQLMNNFKASMEREGRDIFYMEEDEFIHRLREYVNNLRNRYSEDENDEEPEHGESVYGNA